MVVRSSQCGHLAFSVRVVRSVFCSLYTPLSHHLVYFQQYRYLVTFFFFVVNEGDVRYAVEPFRVTLALISPIFGRESTAILGY